MIRSVQSADAAAICAIYNHYIAHTVVTFEEEILPVPEIMNRISAVTADYPWLVFEEEGSVVGYAYAARWKSRCSYRYAVESSVYVHPEATGRGIGSRLYGELLPLLPPLGAHAVVAGIALPNPGSVVLHETFGFTKVAHFREVGRKFDQWIDVGYWEWICPAAGAAQP